MAKDDELRDALLEIAESSAGALVVEVSTTAEVSKRFGVELGRSTNPVYVLTQRQGDEAQIFIAFTLVLDGNRRPATRAEALGKSISASNGAVFELNPFLLIYDYVEGRILAVPAIELFDAFAKHAASTQIPYADSASFSLSPNFQHKTISMYAELAPPQVRDLSISALSLASLQDLLDQIRTATADKNSRIPSIVSAIRARLDAAPSKAGYAVPVPALSATANSATEIADSSDFVKVDDRLWSMIVRAITTSTAVFLVGPPGTGKSALLRRAVKAISDLKVEAGEPAMRPPLWATPDEGWTARELIGGDTVLGGEIVFRPGWVLRSIAENRWLVLDEANRGDLDRIFGPLLTWLSGGVVVVGIESADVNARVIELGWSNAESRVEVVEANGDTKGVVRYLAGKDWRMLGTYNALDAQRVFRLGAALGRRFARVPIPAVSPSLFQSIIYEREPALDPKIRDCISALYDAHYRDEATRVGPASFLSMCSYVREGVAEYLVETDGKSETASEEDLEGRFNALVAEAYLISLGTELAKFEEPDFEQLVERLQSGGAISGSEIAWLTGAVKVLA